MQLVFWCLLSEGDPTNYLTHFRRATVYLAIGKSKSALPDLERVIELKPDFLQARIHRGNVLLKQGRRETAKQEFEELLKIDSSNEEAVKKVGMTTILLYAFTVLGNVF